MSENARSRPVKGTPVRRRTAPAVLATLVCAVGLFAASAGTWIHASVQTTLQPLVVDVAGSDAAPAVTALGLVAGAAALASSLGGRVLRSVLGAIVSAVGAGAAIAVLSVTADPENAARATVGARTGAVGTAGQYDLTAWPWLALGAALALALSGVWLMVVARTAPRKAGQRYDRAALAGERGSGSNPSASPHADDIDSWDALTRGEDPTSRP